MKSRIITGSAVALMIAGLSIAPAFAQSTSSTKSPGKSGVTQAQRMQALGARGEQEVQVRIDSLNKLITRIQGLRNVSDAQKSSIVTTIQSLITNLTNLENQIKADDSTTTLKADMQSITQNYRVYALAIPQLNVLAAADRIVTIYNMMTILGGKLQTRLSGASGVPNMSSLQSALSDFSAKISDANTQAQAAVSEVSPLTPDQGDKTIMASNLAKLKDARSKIKAAQQDLVAARKDAKMIIDALVKSDKSMMGEGNSEGRSNGTASSTDSDSNGTSTRH